MIRKECTHFASFICFTKEISIPGEIKELLNRLTSIQTCVQKMSLLTRHYPKKKYRLEIYFVKTAKGPPLFFHGQEAMLGHKSWTENRGREGGIAHIQHQPHSMIFPFSLSLQPVRPKSKFVFTFSLRSSSHSAICASYEAVFSVLEPTGKNQPTSRGNGYFFLAASVQWALGHS